MTLKCVVPGCKSECETLYRFPSPRTCIKEFKRWSEILHMDALYSLTPEKVYAVKRICAAHFDDSCKSPGNPRLHVNAVPTIGLPDVHLTSKSHKLYNTVLHSKRHSSKKIQTFQQRLRAAERYATLANLENMCLTPCAAKFFHLQIHKRKYQHKGRQFTQKEKKQCLMLLKNYPKSYHLLQTIFTLPCKQTLVKFLNHMSLRCGVNQHLFNVLRKDVMKLQVQDRYCVVMFDEIRLQAQLRYNKQEDLIEGFVDNGRQRTAVLADHALVFMVRGILHSWKQPVAFTFSSGATPSAELVEQVSSVIESLLAIGLRPVATVCDQSAPNVTAVNTLLRTTEESYHRREIAWPGGFFTVKKTKIYPLYDVPHLLKGIRNHMMTKVLRFTENDKTMEAKWKHVVGLYEYAKKDLTTRGLSLLPRLTEEHIYPTQGQKQSVKLCSQVFSQQVAATLSYVGKCPSSGLGPGTRDTAMLLVFFDKLFDSVNSRSFDVPDIKPLRAPVTQTSVHQEFWHHAIKVLCSMQFIEPVSRKVVRRPHSLTHWINTIRGLHSLWNTLRARGFKHLQVRHCNQDVLNSFLDSISNRGARNIHPTCNGFIAAFKTVTLNDFPASRANCEVDDSEKALCTRPELFARRKRPLQASSCRTANQPDMSAESYDYEKELLANTSYYSCKRVVKILRQVYNKCTVCNMDLFTPVTRANNMPGRLNNVSQQCQAAFVRIRKIVKEMIPKYCSQHNICATVADSVRANVDFTFLTCSVHRVQVREIFIKKTIELILTGWMTDVNRILSGQKRRGTSNDCVKMQAFSCYEKKQRNK